MPETEDKRYIIIRENIQTGEMVEVTRCENLNHAKIAKACQEYGSSIGWVKDMETGEIF